LELEKGVWQRQITGARSGERCNHMVEFSGHEYERVFSR